MPSKRKVNDDLVTKIVSVILEIIEKIPPSKKIESKNPEEEANKLIYIASLKAAGISATFAIPPGPVGFLTVIPDLMAIWEIQKQLISDIASLYGKKNNLKKEELFFCLFKHSSAQAFKKIIIETGGSIMVRRVTLRMFQQQARKIGIKITQRVIGKTFSRLIPIFGIAGLGLYTYWDTLHVGKNAIGFFQRDIFDDVLPDQKKVKAKRK